MKRGLVFVLVVATSLLFCSTGWTKEIILKIAHSMPAADPTYPKHGHAVAFKEMVESRTKGAVKVEIYPLAQLYGDPDAVVAVANGTIFGAIVDTPILTAWDKGFDVFSLAGLFMDVDHLQRFIASNKGGKLLEKRLEAKRIKIAYWVSAPIHIFTVKQPIHKLEDMKGLKIRTQPAAVIVESMRGLNATGIPIPIGELYTAAQTGMVDGVATQELSIQMRKLDEVFRYCLLDPILFFNNGASVYSTIQLEKMPPQVREIVEKAWQETAPIHEKVLLEKWTNVAHKKMLEKGMTFTKLSPEEKARFDKVWNSVRIKFTPEIGMDLYDEAMRLRK